jgi:membrane fusion protein (multidrug efflux system)
LNLVKQHPLLVILAILVAGIAALTVRTYVENRHLAQGNWNSGATIVVTDHARLTPIVDEIESIGTAQANESVELTSKVTDTVSKVNFQDGMYAQKGDILVELTNTEETAELNEAQATVDEATRQYNRVKNLIDQKLAAETQLDEERVKMQTARARLEAIVARLDDRLIRAPFSGVLGFRAVSPGTLLSPTTPVTTLDDISTIKLDFHVPETYLANLKPGQEVIAKSVAYPDKEFAGKVKTVNSRVDPVTRTLTVRARINNGDRLLRPGMLLTVKLILARSDILAIPEEAVIPIQDREYVYTISDQGVAERREITVGRRKPGIVEVTSGLKEGDEVITQGVIKIHPGSKVLRKASQTAGGEAKPAPNASRAGVHG